MHFGFKSLLLSASMALGLHADFVDQKTQDEKAERDVAALLVQYNDEQGPPMADTITSQADIQTYLKAHNSNTTHLMTFTFEKDTVSYLYDVKDIIQMAEESKADYIFLNMTGQEDRGYMLPLMEAKFLQNAHETLQKKAGLSGQAPLYIEYDDSVNAYVSFSEDKRIYPDETVLFTGELKKSRAAVAFTVGHETEHYFHSKKDNNYRSHDDARQQSRDNETKADDKAVASTSKLGAFLTIARGYCTPGQKNDPAQVLKDLQMEKKKHDCSSHPSDLERLVNIHRKYPNSF